MLKSTTQAMRASQWIESKLKRSITKNMMYPACSDMRLPMLIPWGHADLDRPLPRPKSGMGAPPLLPHRARGAPLPTSGAPPGPCQPPLPVAA